MTTAGILKIVAAAAIFTGRFAIAESAPTADNSRQNATQNGSAEPSAEQQSNADRDVDITRRIRRALTSDETLSTYAHNVKVIARGGSVVLKGPVRSVAEKQRVEQKAARAVTGVHIVNQLEIAP